MDTNKENKPLLFKDEIYQVTGCAMRVLNTLGHGFAEKVYENSIAIEFDENSISYIKQPNVDVFYNDTRVGHYIPDFIVMNEIIIELKTIPKITDSEVGQVINYLKATKLKAGLILNFKHSQLEWKRVLN